MRSSAVGPDRAVDRSSAPPPRAANLYACHEVMGATACVKVFGWRPHDGGAADTWGRRTQTSKRRKPREV